ncbi:facilitated trehalose transporter Tret1-like [Periplaneta americana]|uniref:facilitated trehalose transporter Tret1-like n=1 Tax=Periplaneta americana TaxID=6978 RepID=UPI0037E73471
METSESKKRPHRSAYSQAVYIAVASLVCASTGMALGHSAVLLPELQSSNSSIVVDMETGSWIASVYSFTSPIGCLFGGVAMDVWGRKRMFVIFNLLMVLGWTVIAGSQDITMLLVARIIEGFSRGAALTIISVFGDELVSPKLRGTILTGSGSFTCVGIMVISVLSAVVDWRTGSGIAAGVSAISFISTALLPESPMWLVRKNRMAEAQRSLLWLCGPGRDLEAKEELLELQKRLCIGKENVIGKKITTKDTISQCVHLIRHFVKPNILKPFLISHFFNTIQCICGLNLFTYYSIDILSKLRRNSSHGPDDVIANIILSVVRLAATLLTAVLFIWVGRRPIGIVSGLGSFFFATALGVLITVQTSEDRYPISEAVEAWVNFSIVILFFSFISLGFFVLPPLMIGEMQSSTMRSYVCGYIYTTNDLILGAVIKEYPSLSNNLGMNGLFFLFGSSCLVCTVFIILFLPETKDRTLFEIEDYFKQDNVLWLTRKKSINDSNVGHLHT